MFWYLIASTIDTLQNTINGHEIACIWNSKYNVRMYVWSKQMLILYFKNLSFLFLVDFKLRKSSLTITAAFNVLELISVRVVLCMICLTFCPIGSALTKHPVASQIWTHNSKRLKKLWWYPVYTVMIPFRFYFLTFDPPSYKWADLTRGEFFNPIDCA